MPYSSAFSATASKFAWHSSVISPPISIPESSPHFHCARIPPQVSTGIWISVRPKRRVGTFVPSGGGSAMRGSQSSLAGIAAELRLLAVFQAPLGPCSRRNGGSNVPAKRRL